MGSGIQKKIREANSNIARLELLEKKLEVAEKNIQLLNENCQKNFTVIEQKFTQSEEILDALITIQGMEQVFERMKERRNEKAEADAEVKKVALEAAIKEGKVVPAEVVGASSVIIGTETDKDGNQLHPIRVQLLFAQITDKDLAELINGKKVGDVLKTKLETTFTISEIYDIVLPTPSITTEAVEQGPPSDPVSPEVEEALINELSQNNAETTEAALN